MRSDWVGKDDIGHVLSLLMPANRLVMEVALHTGLRISDILSLRTDKLALRMSVREQKTGKIRRVSLSKALYERLQLQAGKIYVFEGKRSVEAHRTRQAVWADVVRAAKALRFLSNVTPHSARKIYAVELYKQYGDLDLAKRTLNHDNLEVTLLYALADTLAARRAPSAKASAAGRSAQRARECASAELERGRAGAPPTEGRQADARPQRGRSGRRKPPTTPPRPAAAPPKTGA